MIVFYSTATSPNALKVRLLLREAAIAHREVRVRRDTGENRTPTFLRISPAGTVPAIVDEETGASVFESMAILIFLADQSGRFLPAAPSARADVMKWLAFAAANIDPPIENIYQLTYRSDPWIDGGLAFQKEKLRTAVGLLDAQLGRGDYVAGQCSIADFALFPALSMLEDFVDIPVSTFPHVARWIETMHARPAVRQLLSGAGPET